MKRSTFKVAFFLKRNALRKSGNMPIVARISIDAATVQFSTKLEINPEAWSVALGRVAGRGGEALRINNTLDSIRTALANIYHEQHEKGNTVTAEKLKNLFLGHDDSQATLLQLFAKHNADSERLVGISTTRSTYKKYDLAMRRIEEFLRFQYNLSDISLKELNLNFIRDYELFLRTNCSLSNNVAAKMIMFLKKIVTLAFNNGMISSNPFANYHIKLNRVDRGYLTNEELEVMMSKEISIKRLDQVRDVFVFCCFTGLSYVDVRNLTHSNVRTSFDGKVWIMTKRQKTDNPVNVLLLDVPRMIIEKYSGKLPCQLVLPVMSNQKMNAYLKELADICGIEKNLTFHMSRHTFSTTVTLSNGVPIETVSKMLGHSNIKTTQIYARITNNKISSDMQMLADKLQGLNQAYKG